MAIVSAEEDVFTEYEKTKSTYIELDISRLFIITVRMKNNYSRLNKI